MNIRMIKLPIKDLIVDYKEDMATSKVSAMGGKLDVRPEYQREYVYNDEKRDAVINTILKGFPLNIMYFVEHKDGTFEVLDGQQRIISICRYATNMYSVKIPTATGGYNTVNYPNLFDEQSEQFLNYELQVYICDGTDKEKLEWFEIINIAGEQLETQEIRNAIYHSKWLTDAKSVFSRFNCAAYKNYGKYMSGEYIRQKYLETVFSWAADKENLSGQDVIAKYMQNHRNDDNADDLWNYFEKIFDWVEKYFGTYNKFMKGIKWGILYNKHKDDNLDPKDIQQKINKYMADDEVNKKNGIYEFILTNDEKLLSLRQFDDADKATMYTRQNGKCAICGNSFEMKDMHGDHIKPWSKGGRTTLDNGQMLCTTCNLKKGAH